MKNNELIIAGLIISAGLSRRMGDFKPLLVFEGKTFIKNISDKLIEFCDRIVIVTGYNKKAIEKEIGQFEYGAKIEFAFNPDYQKGMFTSLKAGLKLIHNCDWIIYHFVDQPNIPFQFYTDFVKQIDLNYDLIQPGYKSRRGHPLLIKSELANILSGYDSESSLREFIMNESVKVKLWECSYPEILVDIDTPKDFSDLQN
jgi:molybdenum cofactor cytidylyltransferase